MKPLALIFLAGLAASGTVQAQSANIYGTLDVGIESLSNVQQAGSRITRVPSNTGLFPSRLGLRRNHSEVVHEHIATLEEERLDVARSAAKVNRESMPIDFAHLDLSLATSAFEDHPAA